MFRTAIFASLMMLVFQAQASETVTVQNEAIFSAVYSDNQALVGYFANAEKVTVNYALCDLNGETLVNCQSQSPTGFNASADNLERLRFQFDHNLTVAYRLTQLAQLPSVTSRFEYFPVDPMHIAQIFSEMKRTGKTLDQVVGAEVSTELSQNGDFLRQTLDLPGRESSMLLSLTPAQITARQMNLLNPDDAPSLNLDVVASALKISMEQM